jgi:hypothetical protein
MADISAALRSASACCCLSAAIRGERSTSGTLSCRQAALAHLLRFLERDSASALAVWRRIAAC